MSELLEGYYKASDTFYKILQVCFIDINFYYFCSIQNENGAFRASDASGTEFSVQVEYGDFGK